MTLLLEFRSLEGIKIKLIAVVKGVGRVSDQPINN